MTIIFYTYTLNKESGGALHSTLILINEFLKRGHDVKVIIHNKTEQDVPIDCEVFVLNQRFGDLSRIIGLRSIIDMLQPDVIIANMKPQNINLAIAKLILGNVKTKFIGIERNPDLQYRYGHGKILFRKIMRWLYNTLDVIVANSNATKDDLKKSFFVSDEKIEVIYNTVDFERIKEKSKETIEHCFESIFSKDVIINVGRLTAQKGQNLLLESFKILKERNHSDINLVFIGSGNRENYLKKLTERLGLVDNVFFLGHQDNPFKFIKKSKVFALTSNYEGFGRVVLESMSLDIPVIAFSSVGGHNELLTDDCGILVQHKDTEALADGMKKLLEETDLRKSIILNAKNSLEKYSLEKHINAFLKLFV